ncbi:xanthine dehydrogenase-like isoform X2 [Mizuhopecten yessoensis]|uniref:Xanthine dehydrogenase n=1 Tax=Mizuhopecten yessoensis TaxID=6573 RepID=A0A210QB94_MIZYE|nr:xanthine dehydrogenase-like isoform X2 [Mizuhopecten yessoensis]OWF46006.1 Xanthine dehydrogenase [Mizuhopecten yessoensis]
MDARPQQTSSLVFYVNGKKVVDPDPDPETTLLQFLRTKLRLTGTKLGCGEGGCGACTVMVSACDTVSNQVRHFSVNACLAPICSLHGLAITTVEGIGSIKHGLHPVQEKIAKAHGSQCGFCTPGIVMSMYTLLRNITNPSMKDMESAFEGNLCRCTGYRPILEGFKSFTKEACALGTACCRNQTKSNGDSNSDRRTVNGSVVSTCNGDALALVNGNGFVDHQAMTNGDNQTTDLLPADSTQDPIFPPQLRTSEYDDQFLYYKGERAVWYRPTSLDQLLELKAVHPTAKLVIGNTEIGVEIKFKNMHYPVMIAPTHIPELRSVVTVGDGILFGASVTLTQLNETLNGAIDTMPEHKTGIFKAIVEMLRWFAGHQIRNVAAIGGNIMTASPISDLNPLFMAAGVMLQVASKGERRTIKMDEHFFLGYRRPAVHADEVLVSLTIPFTQEVSLVILFT